MTRESRSAVSLLARGPNLRARSTRKAGLTRARFGRARAASYGGNWVTV